MDRNFPFVTSSGLADSFGRGKPGQLTYSSHPPLLGQVLRDDAWVSCVMHSENLTSRTSRLTIPPEKLSCIY